jgi:hypothetical protein
MPPRPIETRRKISRPGRKSKADVAHIVAATRLSLRKSPLYKPYRNAIHSIAGFADIPRGALELRRSPEYQEVHSQLTGLIIELRQQAKER